MTSQTSSVSRETQSMFQIDIFYRNNGILFWYRLNISPQFAVSSELSVLLLISQIGFQSAYLLPQSQSDPKTMGLCDNGPSLVFFFHISIQNNVSNSWEGNALILVRSKISSLSCALNASESYQHFGGEKNQNIKNQCNKNIFTIIKHYHFNFI